ncbi:acyl-CoA synthetase [Caenimonas koreensis DSM 17982]|uniref:Acyl-CoA synthetase n=1 Tax=Caenimonas koreensis DSM 17982 TaxID=1121255 RepID=A0A844AXB4_9BURK|nr:acyl-CoA synthetase [Caenimonas koreensis]MRD49015.1 acyl-CoA synthetase [Caenimonas koreensis DSM 17982]
MTHPNADSSHAPLCTPADIAHFEAALPLQARLPGRSIYNVFEAAARQWPDATALTMLMTGAPDEQPRRVNYADLLQLIGRTANLFHSIAGPRAGVAYMLPSLVETHATLWGAETAGYAVPINFLLQPAAIAELLKASGVKILVALGPHPVLDIWQKALALRDEVPGLTLVRIAAPGVALEPGVVDFHSGIALQPHDHLVFGKPCEGDDVCAYFHTGGTTGAPKLVAHTHTGQLSAALGGASLADMRAGDVLTASLPLFHVGGTIFCGLSAFMAGVQLLVMSPGGMRNPAMVSQFWRLVDKYKVTLAGAVPTSVGAVLDVPVGDADISSIRAGFCGAASLPLAVGERFRKVTGCNLYEVYGMTEASGLICIDPVQGPGGVGSVGFPLPYTKVRTRRLDAHGKPGADCAPGEVGVVTIAGPHVSPGYRSADHNNGVFIDGGELNSGDLGYFDDTGRLHIAGRAKDLIIRSGHNIDPLMIENAMQQHPSVAVAAAVGIPDAYAGELPACYVQLRPGMTATEDELREHAEATISERPAWPRSIFIVDVVPLTTVGKIYKPSLRCDAAARLVTQWVKQLGVSDAVIDVREGGRRGMTVTVELPESARALLPAVQDALKPYLFESSVVMR